MPVNSGNHVRRYITDLPVDIFEPERSKFRPILLMIHDLWVGGWCWHDWATRFSNLGWECWAVSLRGRDPARGLEEGKGQTFDDCARDLNRLCDTLTSPAIVMAHGFGLWLAHTVCTKPGAVAAVSVAPALGIANATDELRALRLLQLKYLPLMLLRQPVLIRSSDFSTLWLNRVGEDFRREILEALVPESPQLVRAFFQQMKRAAIPNIGLPILALGGTEDRLMPKDSAEALATRLRGSYHLYPERGHWMLHEDGWENVVNDVHRWILNTLGESILVEDGDR